MKPLDALLCLGGKREGGLRGAETRKRVSVDEAIRAKQPRVTRLHYVMRRTKLAQRVRFYFINATLTCRLCANYLFFFF